MANGNKYNFFHIDTSFADEIARLGSDDFTLASAQEKEDMIETRPSVSYWKDALRRFKKNRISMLALFLFLLIAFFSFFGPLFVPYDYANQYRNSTKLGPLEFSQKEQLASAAYKQADYGFSTSLVPGSLNTISANTYVNFKIGSADYHFYNEKAISDTILLYTKGSDELSLIKEADAEKGNFTPSAVIPLEEGRSDDPSAIDITFSRKVFPHYFGTDSAGRDIMARTMYGGRVSISIGIIAALIVLVIGSIYGAISGLSGGAVDFVMMRIVDIIYSVPDVLIVLLLQVVLKDPLQAWLDSSGTAFSRMMSNLGVGIISIFITFACLYWVGMSRIVRGQVLQLKNQEFVTAARALGVPNSTIIKRHLLPNCVGQLVIATCLQIPSAIFLESFLSFLGLGVSVPMTSLGSLCSEALDTMTIYPYRLLLPGMILTLLVLSLNLIGDGVRDALDPRLKK